MIAWIRKGLHMLINVNSGGHWVAVDEAKSLATGQIYIYYGFPERCAKYGFNTCE